MLFLFWLLCFACQFGRSFLFLLFSFFLVESGSLNFWWATSHYQLLQLPTVVLILNVTRLCFAFVFCIWKLEILLTGDFCCCSQYYQLSSASSSHFACRFFLGAFFFGLCCWIRKLEINYHEHFLLLLVILSASWSAASSSHFVRKSSLLCFPRAGRVHLEFWLSSF